MASTKLLLYTTAEIVDDRAFNFGEIWLIRDEIVGIPDADRTVNQRNIKASRPVVIVDNNTQNFNKLYPIITVVPTSSRTDCQRAYDIPLDPQVDKGLTSECLLRMGLAQPVLKKDLYKCIGEVSADTKLEIQEIILDKIGMTLEEDELTGPYNEDDEEEIEGI